MKQIPYRICICICCQCSGSGSFIYSKKVVKIIVMFITEHFPTSDNIKQGSGHTFMTLKMKPF
jgi:hypothetical protein